MKAAQKVGKEPMGRMQLPCEHGGKEVVESTFDFRAISENITDVLCIHHLDGSYAYLSPSASTVLGSAPEELLGRSFYACVHPEDCEKVVKPVFGGVLEGAARGMVEFRHRKNGGRYVWLEATFAPILRNGSKVTHVLSVSRDVTERRRTQEALRHAMERLRTATGRVIDIIVMTVETRDSFTIGHQRRVATLAASIAQAMGLPKERIEAVRMAGTMHDLGKIMIPLEILNAPRKLTDLEFELVKAHAEMGHDILKDIDFEYPIADIVLQHHERMNGSGYPNGLIGGDLLLEAKIMMVADVVEATTSRRSYRSAYGQTIALEEVTKYKDRLYDPDVVEACVKLFREDGFKFS